MQHLRARTKRINNANHFSKNLTERYCSWLKRFSVCVGRGDANVKRIPLPRCGQKTKNRFDAMRCCYDGDTMRCETVLDQRVSVHVGDIILLLMLMNRPTPEITVPNPPKENLFCMQPMLNTLALSRTLYIATLFRKQHKIKLKIIYFDHGTDK